MMLLLYDLLLNVEKCMSAFLSFSSRVVGCCLRNREEVNGVTLDQLLDTDTTTNFGWGRNIEDGKAREGMFYMNPGNGGE